MASENTNSKKLEKLNYILYFAITLLVVALGFYFYNFNNGLSDDSSTWGTFGDFIGGTLNPIFALFSLFAIIYTIKIQTQELEFSREELKATKEELEKSRIAQQEQSESLKLQNEATKLQIFENTFFSLLKEVHGIIEYFYSEEFKEENVSMKINKLLNTDTVSKNELTRVFNIENNGLMKSYFLMLYQLIKYIDDNKISEKRIYINIIRANLDNQLLALLAINCYVNNFPKYKEYLEKYAFFEHLDISSDNLLFLTPILIDGYSDIKIYGKNQKIIEELEQQKKK